MCKSSYFTYTISLRLCNHHGLLLNYHEWSMSIFSSNKMTWFTSPKFFVGSALILEIDWWEEHFTFFPSFHNIKKTFAFFFFQKSEAVRATWGKDCDHFLIMSSSRDEDDGKSTLSKAYQTTYTGCANKLWIGSSNLCEIRILN